MSDVFVLDASVALSWCFEDEASEFADGILDSLKTNTALVPSVLFQLEICNGLLVAERRQRLSELQVREWKSQFEKLAIIAIAVPLAEVFELARRHQRSSYDGAYLTLAKRQNVPLATLDGGMRQAAKEAGVALLT
ncbi:MAG: type II toxin-antitoxin system VapC family toxin [Planctomycetota bacterium]